MALIPVGKIDLGELRTDAEKVSMHYGTALDVYAPIAESQIDDAGTSLANVKETVTGLTDTTYYGLKSWQWGILIIGLFAIFYYMYREGKKKMAVNS